MVLTFRHNDLNRLLPLKELLAPLGGGAKIVSGPSDLQVSGVEIDSRHINAGNLFIAVNGTNTRGILFAKDALDRGASAIACCVDELSEIREQDWKAVITLDDPRWSAGILASRFWDNPSRKLCLIGITGTNGKTTTSYLLESIWRVAGLKTGVIGTVNYRILAEDIPATVTTPDPVRLQAILHDMVLAGVNAVALECSSHALQQDRVNGCRFAGAVFTNLTQDHLDYHIDMESYFKAKARLFNLYTPSFSVINTDNRWGIGLWNTIIGRKISYGFNQVAMIRPLKWTQDKSGIKARLITPKGMVDIETRLLGRHNLYNIMAAVGVCVSMDIDLYKIALGVAALPSVPGRSERVDSPEGITALVDYAHTPDALSSVLDSLSSIDGARILLVIGCGGDRDRTKRPLMAKIAVSRADVVIFTSDNPRSEPPEQILDDMLQELSTEERNKVQVIPDRREAIFKMAGIATAGDIVLVAGKGHETYQIIGSKKYPFDDRLVLKEAFQAAG